MLAQGDFDFHTRISIITQHLHDAANWLRMLVGVLDNLQYHHLPGLGATRTARFDQNILSNASILGHHELDAVFFIQAADHFIVSALQHFDNLGFRTTAPVHASLPHHHHVAIQYLMHFLLGEEHVSTAVFRDQEAETIRMTLYFALYQVELVHHADGTLAVAHDLTVAFHRAQTAREQIFLFTFNEQHIQQLIITHRSAMLSQNLQNKFATWQRMFVLFTLAFEVWILQT